MSTARRGDTANLACDHGAEQGAGSLVLYDLKKYVELIASLVVDI